MRPRSLQQRIAVYLTFFSILVAFPLILVGAFINERAEQEFWKQMLSAELADIDLNIPRGEVTRHGVLNSYVWRTGVANSPKVVPPEIASLTAGLHDNIQYDGREWAVLVREQRGVRAAASIDITELEFEEAELSTWAIAATLLAIVLLLVALNWLARRAVDPVTALSAQLATRSPTTTTPVVTEFKEREITAVVDALNGFVSRIHDHVQREKVFVETMSHELRTPLAVILGAVEVLELPGASEARSRAALTRIRDTAKGLTELTQVLLFLSNRKEPAVNNSPVSLEEVLKRSLALFEQGLASKGMRIELTVASPVVVNAEPSLCAIVVNNLIRNCCDHGVGSVDIRLTAEGLSISNRIESGSGHDAPPSWRGNIGLGLELIDRTCLQLGWQLRTDGDGDVFSVEVTFGRTRL